MNYLLINIYYNLPNLKNAGEQRLLINVRIKSTKKFFITQDRQNWDQILPLALVST